MKVGSTVAAKRVLMSPEAAFPYVFAAEGAQHPLKKPPRSTPLPQHPPKRPPRSTTLAAAAATLNLEVCAAPSGRRAAFFGAEGS